MFEQEKVRICREMRLEEDRELTSPALRVLGFFRQLGYRVAEFTQRRPEVEYLEEIKQLKLRLAEKMVIKPPTSDKEDREANNTKTQELLQFIQEEMKSQFTQLQIALDFSSDKF